MYIKIILYLQELNNFGDAILNKYPILKNRALRLQNMKVDYIKQQNEDFNKRIQIRKKQTNNFIFYRTGSLDFKKFEKDFELYKGYKKLKSDSSRNTPISKKRGEISPFYKVSCFIDLRIFRRLKLPLHQLGIIILIS